MIRVFSKCGHQGCSKTPRFGFEKGDKRECFGTHAADGMVSCNPDQRSNARRIPKAGVPRVPVPSKEKTVSEEESLAEVADCT